MELKNGTSRQAVKQRSGILEATSNGLRQRESFARRAEITMSCTSNISPRWCYVEHWNQMEISLVTYGFNKDRERIEHHK